MLTQETWDNTNPWLWEQAKTTGSTTALVLATDLAVKASQWTATCGMLEFILQIKIYLLISGGQNGLFFIMSSFLQMKHSWLLGQSNPATQTWCGTTVNTSNFRQKPHASLLCSHYSCNNKAQAYNKAILFRWAKKSTYVSSVLRSLLLHHEEKFCLISNRTHRPLYSIRDHIQNSPCVFVIWNKPNKHNFYSVDMNIWKMTSTWFQCQSIRLKSNIVEQLGVVVPETWTSQIKAVMETRFLQQLREEATF